MGTPQIDLEEGKDNLHLRCEADGNPPASIVWRRAGRSEIASLTESLQLRPVGRRDSGVYTCQAQNSVGTSDTLSVQLDIKCKLNFISTSLAKQSTTLALTQFISLTLPCAHTDPPRITSAGPDRLTTAPLFSPAAFECIAEGNPAPTYKWVQR